MTYSPPLFFVVVAALIAGWYVRDRSRKPNKLPLPPGPPRLPIIGNLHQAPALWPWRTYHEWAKTYGPIMSVQYGKDTVIILSNHTTAQALLDRRSNLYSSRPVLIMGPECVSKGNRSVFMPYAQKYRNHQRIQGGLVHPRFAKEYVRLQDLESKQLIFELLDTGEDDWMGRFHRYSSSVIFGLAYGKRMPRGDEEELKIGGQVMDNILYAARVGTWIVDSVPILNKLPKALAPWKKTADRYYDLEVSFHLGNLQEGERSESWNWSKQVLASKESKGMTREELAYCVGGMYDAGSDTTTMALHTFVLAALTQPEAMKAAQKELDAILGDKFPTIEDRPRLACIEAVVKETLRWRPVSPGGIPHAIDQKDDEYMGYRIPRNSIIVPNHWAMNLDETVYGPDVLEFRTSRHIENPELPIASWGYGRRVCTGQHVAMNSLFLNVARVLWAFDIEHAVDAQGRKVEVDPLAYSQGINSSPLPFKARFVVRSEKRKKEVQRQWDEAEKDVVSVLGEIERAIPRGG